MVLHDALTCSRLLLLLPAYICPDTQLDRAAGAGHLRLCSHSLRQADPTQLLYMQACVLL